MVQPTINPVYDTRQAEQSLLLWSDNAVKDYYTYVRNTWDKNLLAKGGLSGLKGWETLLQTGFVKVADKTAGSLYFHPRPERHCANNIEPKQPDGSFGR